MVDNRRGKPRVSCEEFEDDWLFEGETPSRQSPRHARRRQRSRDDDDQDYLPGNAAQILEELSHGIDPDAPVPRHRQPAAVQGRRHQRLPLRALSVGLAIRNRISANAPECRVTPLGEECDFFLLGDVQDRILKPDSYFQRNAHTVNVLVPEYDPSAENKLQFFQIEGQIAKFDVKSISAMSDTEIDEHIAMAEAELDIPTVPDASALSIVLPYEGSQLRDSVQIHADVTRFDWADFASRAHFDVVIMDPPWWIQAANPTRGVELAYELLETTTIAKMPINLLQGSGFLFMWVLASTLFDATEMLENWGYQIVNHINWVKTSKRGIYAPSNACYLQHCKETCLVAVKGNGFDGFRPEYLEDLIVRWRNLRQSHKPDELYVMVEKAFPGGRYLEIFARPHNLRRGWVSLGLEVPK